MPKGVFTRKVIRGPKPYAEKALNQHLKQIKVSRRNVRGMSGTQTRKTNNYRRGG